MRTDLLTFTGIFSLCAGSAGAARLDLTATQVDFYGQEVGRAYHSVCTLNDCEATLPVEIGGNRGVRCRLYVHVSAPAAGGKGAISFAAGSCESGVRLGVTPNAATADYQVDSNAATSKSFSLPFQSLLSAGRGGMALDDAVWHASATVRLDIIVVKSR